MPQLVVLAVVAALVVVVAVAVVDEHEVLHNDRILVVSLELYQLFLAPNCFHIYLK